MPFTSQIYQDEVTPARINNTGLYGQSRPGSINQSTNWGAFPGMSAQSSIQHINLNTWRTYKSYQNNPSGTLIKRSPVVGDELQGQAGAEPTPGSCTGHTFKPWNPQDIPRGIIHAGQVSTDPGTWEIRSLAWRWACITKAASSLRPSP